MRSSLRALAPLVSLLALTLPDFTRAAHAQSAPQPKAAAGPRAAGAPVGLELYSLREIANRDLPAALKRTREMGFTDIEMFNYSKHTAAEVRRMIDDAGLTCSSMHVGYEQLASSFDTIVSNAKTLGASQVVVPWIPHSGPFTESIARAAIANFNRWAPALKKQGLSLAYHAHGYEFEPRDGSTLFDLIASQTKKETFNFQLDVYWAWHGGQDPVALMRKYPDRFPTLHLKDMQRGVHTGVFTGETPKNDSVVLGRGQLDFPAILKEAAAIGVRESYIEDEAENASNQIPLSLDYLKTLDH